MVRSLDTVKEERLSCFFSFWWTSLRWRRKVTAGWHWAAAGANCCLHAADMKHEPAAEPSTTPPPSSLWLPVQVFSGLVVTLREQQCVLPQRGCSTDMSSQHTETTQPFSQTKQADVGIIQPWSGLLGLWAAFLGGSRLGDIILTFQIDFSVTCFSVCEFLNCVTNSHLTVAPRSASHPKISLYKQHFSSSYTYVMSLNDSVRRS